MKEKVIVTGGAGFIGSHLSARLVELGHEVHIIDSLVAGKEERVPVGATLHVFDIRDTEKLTSIFEAASYVFHLAALPSVPFSIENPVETHDVNTLGTLKVLMAAKNAGVRRVVFSSSSAVYGEQPSMPITEASVCKPNSPYGLQKLEGEYYMKLASELYALETISLRYFNLYGLHQNAQGPYASVVAKFLDSASRNEPLSVVGDGSQTRDFVHVDDVVEANICAMNNKNLGKGEVFNVGGGVGYSINEIAKLIGGDIIHVPPRVEIKDSCASIEYARDALGWQPRKVFKEEIELLRT